MRIIMDPKKFKTLVDPNNGYKVKRRNKIVKQNEKLQRDLVSVSLKKVAHGPAIIGHDGQFVIVVAVHSTHKPGLKAQIEVDPGKATDQAGVYYLVEVAAGAAAEHLAEMYGDRLDPDWCAKQAKELFKDVMRKYAEMKEKGQDLQVQRD